MISIKIVHNLSLDSDAMAHCEIESDLFKHCVCVTVVNVVIIASQPRPYCTLKISNSIELDFECSSMCATYSIYALEK